MRKPLSVLLILFTITASAQTEKQDPLQKNYSLGSSSEMVIFWNFDIHPDSSLSYRVLDYYGNFGEYIIEPKEKGNYDNNLSISDINPVIDIISDDFTGDGLDNIAAAWTGTGNSLNIIIPEIEKESLSWSSENVLSIANALYNYEGYLGSARFRLIKGFFDFDPEAEFAAAYWNSSGELELKIFDINPTSLMPVEKASIADENMSPDFENPGLFDISAGDFDGDLRDEIAAVVYEETDNEWSFYVKIYNYEEVNGVLTLIAKAKKEKFYSSDDFFGQSYRINNIAIAAGDFTNNTLDEFVVDFVLYNNGSITYNYLLPGNVNITLDTIFVNHDNLESVFQTNGKTIVGIGVTTGDINNDGRDEIVVDGDGRIRIYEINNDLKLVYRTGNSEGSYHTGNRRLLLEDLDASTEDSVWNPEIILSTTTYVQPDNSEHFTTMNVSVYEPVVDPSGNILSLQHRKSISPDTIKGSPSAIWAIAAGDFDRDGIRLGKPNYYSRTDIVQPLVILNAPPKHFDLLNGSIFDVNNCFNGQVCQSFAQFYTESSSEIEVATTFNSDWKVGSTVKGGFKIPIIKVGVETKIEGNYGRGFSKRNINRERETVSQNITSSDDDYIYATIIDYDIWEYPIIADDTIQAYTLVISPGFKRKAWFPSKSPQANEYIPDHEVGNILSYRQIASPSDNSAFSSELKWNKSDEVTLDGGQFNYTWSLENESQTQQTETYESKWNIKGEVDFNIPFKFIPDVELRGEYGEERISTQKNTVTYRKGLNVNLGPINKTFGETYYSVTPYAYWAKNGALVLDYAVNPRPSDINVPETWWQQVYAENADPALILPWRLDPDKGNFVDEDKRKQTKELVFNPPNPKPGEMVNISARVHNYSLINTPGAVAVKFFLGDPENGGTEIMNTSTDDYIPARGSKIINFDWQVPSNVPRFPRIYLTLDPDNSINEIHEENNVGWKVLPLEGSVTDVAQDAGNIKKFALRQNYPNPFNPITTIEYEVPEISQVSLIIYDILGREAAALVDEVKNPGIYRVQFNGTNFSSGVYFYKLQGSNYSEVKKLMLMK